MQNALPLIAPTLMPGVPMAAIKKRLDSLVARHTSELVSAWTSIKTGAVAEDAAVLERLQSTAAGRQWLTALRLLHLRAGGTTVDEPGPDDLGECLTSLSGLPNVEADDPVLANLVKNTDNFFGYDLVAVFPRPDGLGFRVVHGAEGERDYESPEDSGLSEEGDFWFVQTRAYEPQGDRAGFIEPKLYLVGNVDVNADNWEPARLDRSSMYELISAVDVIENMPHGLERLGAIGGVPWPTFPSGHEVEIREMGDYLRLLHQRARAGDPETAAAALAAAGLRERLASVQSKAQQLRDEERRLAHEVELVMLRSRLAFHGLEEGALVTQCATGAQGILRVRDQYGPKAVVVPLSDDASSAEAPAAPVGKDGFLCGGSFMDQLRLGEWHFDTEAKPPVADRPRAHCN
jgi:hypothetical protein